MASTASFVGTDTTTQGNWVGVYGLQGYNVSNDVGGNPKAVSPSYVSSMTFNNAINFSGWNGNSSETRVLQLSTGASTGRWAGCFYNGSTWTLTINVTDNLLHKLSIYSLDYDSTNRRQTYIISDASTSTVLDSYSLTSSFNSGIWNIVKFSGSIVVSNRYDSGYNAVTSGFFFDTASPINYGMGCLEYGILPNYAF